MGIIEQLQDQAEKYQTMRAEFDELRTRIINQARWFNLLDPRSFGYKPVDISSITVMLGPDLPTHSQHLDYHRSATRDWNALKPRYFERLEAGGRDITQLQEMLIRRRYYLQDLEDKLDMLRKLKDIRDMIGFVGAT